MIQNVSPSLQAYIERDILPRYETFDKAHQRDHADKVIEQSLQLARFYDVNVDMVYAIAAYHDTGLAEGRETHHLVSGEIIRTDNRLQEWFDAAEIEVMAQAVEDHRASADHEPRSVFGRIVAEADRLIDADTIIRRTVQYGLAHYPELDRQHQVKRALDHLNEKYAEGGYLKLWIPESPNAERLRQLWKIIRDVPLITAMIDRAYEEETSSLVSCFP